jgi:D-glycero-D-manno-heptose 1,7-bisphosphate phosphatase
MVENLLLDRDGVINELIDVGPEEKISPQSLNQFNYLQGSEEAIKKATDSGVSVYVFSNQPDVSKHWRQLDRGSLELINQELKNIGVDKVFNCTHGPKKRHGNRYTDESGDIITCKCRKPQPGLIKACYHTTSMSPPKTIVVGDNDVDIIAASRFEQEYRTEFKSKVNLQSNKLGDVLNEHLQIDTL